jgi:hypothetical protein
MVEKDNLHDTATRRSPNEVAWIQLQQLRLRAEERPHSEIIKLLREGQLGKPLMDLPQRTYFYYWHAACKRELEELEKDKAGLLTSVIAQKRAMLSQAKAQFHKKDDPKILAIANQVHNDAVRQLQEFGFLPKGAEKVELKGEVTVKEEIKAFLASVMKPAGAPENWKRDKKEGDGCDGKEE